MKREARMILVLGLVAFALNMVSFAQQHNHAEHENHSSSSGSAADDVAIFCPTMKTGQLCSHGTSNVLGLTGAKQEKWVEIARKYNKTVDAATLQLFKDSEGVLTPVQMAQLKAWFAIGLNPQINELLYSKGLGPTKN
jgi:hypothetical protein